MNNVNKHTANNNHTALYIHVPFCLKKCLYCDFFSVEKKQISEREGYEYGFLLAREFKFLKKQFPNLFERPLNSIFIGGGTPSIFEPEIYSILFREIENVWGNYRDSEISIEVNPETITEKKISGFLNLGINRISLGVQSFTDELLQGIGRIHDSHKAIDGIKYISSIKDIKSFSFDLMFGLPKQTFKMWQKTLEEAISFNPHHISVYGLTIHPETPLYFKMQKGDLELPDEEAQIEMFLGTKYFLEQAGYTHYEISNYSRNGYSCKHNINYWVGGEYIGIGAGAHAYIDDQHYYNPDDIAFYRNRILDEKSAYIKDHELSNEQRLKEKIMLSLRMISGIDVNDFNQRNNCDLLNDFREPLESLSSLNLIDLTNERIILTNKGLLLADEVTTYFF